MLLSEFLSQWRDEAPTIEVATSGSTGVPKQLRVSKERMRASARMTCDFLGLRAGQRALLCMDLRYIGAKMMVVRALERALRLLCVPPASHPLAGLEEEVDFAAMVPLQVQSSLQVPQEAERLRRIRHLIIGGAAVSPALEDALRTFPHAVWSTYGMTETLSHIALRRLNGPEASPNYVPLPGVSVGQDERGCLTISAPALCATTLHTNDLVELRPDGRFRILGRADNTIVSGGVKIQLEEAERLVSDLHAAPFQLTWVSDERLGQALTLLSVAPCSPQMQNAIHEALPRYWAPRYYFPVPALPLTGNGKPARAEAHRLAQQLFNEQ